MRRHHSRLMGDMTVEVSILKHIFWKTSTFAGGFTAQYVTDYIQDVRTDKVDSCYVHNKHKGKDYHRMDNQLVTI